MKTIEDLAHEHWKRLNNNDPDAYSEYIRTLLGRELDYAAKNPTIDRISRLQSLEKPVHTLALTVGDSFEPLLQVICVLKPKRVILILNHKYSNGKAGDAQGDTLKRLIVQLAKTATLPSEYRPDLCEKRVMVKVIDFDTPTAVFRALRDAFRIPEDKDGGDCHDDDHKRDEFTDAVDITGAKKSMVAGAFLYAAHSGLPITYVDFDSNAYHNTYRRPYGFACRIGEIANPYEAFRLRDWERVRQLYERYDFWGAREFVQGSIDGRLSGILSAMKNPLGKGHHGHALYDPEDIDKVNRLVSVLHVYELWENGDYKQAQRQAQEMQPPIPNNLLPWSVGVLKQIWPSSSQIADPDQADQQLLDEHLALKQGKTGPSDSLFAQPLPLVAYVSDELEKIQRLYKENEDYRSAYLRAAGLHEFLLKGRLALCWLNSGLEAQTAGDSTWKPISSLGIAEHEAFKYMVNDANEWALRQALRSSPPAPYDLKRLKGRNIIRRSSDVPVMGAYGDGLALDLDTVLYGEESDKRSVFVRLRGEAIHTHLYIPRHVAEAAIQLVQSAQKEFEQNWLEFYHPGTTTQKPSSGIGSPIWTILCKELGLDFLPPRLRN